MDEETWMDARKAMELGFIDGMLTPSDIAEAPLREEPLMYSERSAANELRNRISAKRPSRREKDGRRVEDLLERLRLIES